MLTLSINISNSSNFVKTLHTFKSKTVKHLFKARRLIKVVSVKYGKCFITIASSVLSLSVLCLSILTVQFIIVYYTYCFTFFYFVKTSYGVYF